MMKKILILVVAVALVAAGWYLRESYSPPPVSPETDSIVQKENNGAVCAQVITPARDPETGDIREFPTPCEVPEGWELIQNDVPSLDLEVQ